jgi:hypothetical protein
VSFPAVLCTRMHGSFTGKPSPAIRLGLPLLCEAPLLPRPPDYLKDCEFPRFHVDAWLAEAKRARLILPSPLQSMWPRILKNLSPVIFEGTYGMKMIQTLA